MFFLGNEQRSFCHFWDWVQVLYFRFFGWLWGLLHFSQCSCTVTKVLGPTIDFPTWGSSNGTENPQGIWLWGPVVFDYRTFTGLGKEIFTGHKQNFVWTWTKEKGAVTAQETEPDLSVSVQQFPAEMWVNSGLLQGQGHWIQQCFHKPFWRRWAYHSLASGQTTGREHSPTHQLKIGLKIYWAWPQSIRTRPRFPHSQSLPSGSFHKPLILIHQRANRIKTTITEN